MCVIVEFNLCHHKIELLSQKDGICIALSRIGITIELNLCHHRTESVYSCNGLGVIIEYNMCHDEMEFELS